MKLVEAHDLPLGGWDTYVVDPCRYDHDLLLEQLGCVGQESLRRVVDPVLVRVGDYQDPRLILKRFLQ